jgi:hypothetical protein
MKERNAACGSAGPAGRRHLLSAGLGLLVAVLMSCAAQAAAPKAKAASHGPDGFNKAKFGMTLEQVRKLYPAMEVAPQTTAAYVRSPHLTRQLLTKVPVPGLHSPCTIELRFWKNRLWSVITFYAANPYPEVLSNLGRLYGPSTTTGRDPTWVFDKATITTSPGQLWYSFDDNAIAKDVQRELVEAIEQQKARKTPHPAAPQTPATPPTTGQGTPAQPLAPAAGQPN